MTMRLLAILVLIFQSLWTATGGGVAVLPHDPADFSTGCSTSAGLCCCGPVCGSCANTQMACGCADPQTSPPAAPVAPPSVKTGAAFVFALLPAVIITAGPSVPSLTPVVRDAPGYASHNQRHALLCVWLA